MGYYTAMPHKSDLISGKIVWEEGEYLVNERHGRLWLFKRGFQIAELIWGQEGLQKYHKGDYRQWIESVRKKDLKKADGMVDKANVVLQEAEEIRNLWKD